jgi:prepilin peptidase CpaA
MSAELLAAAVASLAAVIDIRTRRIPNWLTLATLLVGLGMHIVRFGVLGGVPIALGGVILGLCLLLPFYVIRAIGAGDVKLLAALGALVGPHEVLSVTLYAALVGGLISVVMLARRHQLRRSLADIVTRPTRLTRGGAKAPYGVAIAAGVYLSILLPSIVG